MVSDYTRLNFDEVLQLDCYTFKKLLIHAFITKMRSTKEGQEWLENAWILTRTDMETDKLQQFKKGGGS